MKALVNALRRTVRHLRPPRTNVVERALDLQLRIAPF